MIATMDHIDSLADLSIRRACAFFGLAMATVMISLSFDPVLAFRTGGEMAALLTLGLLVSAWRAPRRNIQHTELYALLRGTGQPRAGLLTDAMRQRLAMVLQERLFWHAERVGIAAVALWGVALLVWLLRMA